MRWLEEPVFRPPAEAESLIFQVSRGCPHNTCTFCGMYKRVRHRRFTLDKIASDIRGAAAGGFADAKRIFLADGDAMALPFSMLAPVLEELNRNFPRLARVTCYANGSSILDKTDAELADLKRMKLSTVYVGLESGSEKLLQSVRKGETAAGMCEAVRRVQSAGIKASVMILVGLGGRKMSAEHAEETAKAVNIMQPKLLSALRYIEIPGLKTFEGYETLPEYDSACELKRMIELFELESTVFRANHTSVPFPLEGRFPKDRAALAAMLESVIVSGKLDRNGPGQVPLFL